MEFEDLFRFVLTSQRRREWMMRLDENVTQQTQAGSELRFIMFCQEGDDWEKLVEVKGRGRYKTNFILVKREIVQFINKKIQPMLPAEDRNIVKRVFIKLLDRLHVKNVCWCCHEFNGGHKGLWNCGNGS